MRGPAAVASTAPSNNPSIGPAAMIARACPLHRAARPRSAVARACVAMLSAAKDKPHTRRAAISGTSPDSVA